MTISCLHMSVPTPFPLRAIHHPCLPRPSFGPAHTLLSFLFRPWKRVQPERDQQQPLPSNRPSSLTTTCALDRYRFTTRITGHKPPSMVCSHRTPPLVAPHTTAELSLTFLDRQPELNISLPSTSRQRTSTTRPSLPLDMPV